MKSNFSRQVYAAMVLMISMICVGPAFAQFSGSITGVVTDSSGSVVPGAAVLITEQRTQVKNSTVSDGSGIYNFLSLAPGNYQVTVTKAGFSDTNIIANLSTEQKLNLPVKLVVASATQSVQVTAEAPILDTAETRDQLTVESQSVSSLPLPGRSLVSLITLAPGVVGIGQTGGIGGSGLDNFSTETQVSVSANGQGSMANMFVVDGLDVTSTARDGVTNLTPSPDSIQETSVQTNTFDVDYGRGASIQMVMTTKSGTDHYHGSLSEYYTSQQLWARTEFTPISGYAPFHSSNISGTIGGPIIPHHRSFFFFGFEDLPSTLTTDSTVVVEDAAFTQWAQGFNPNGFGTKLLTTYKPTAAVNKTVRTTASQLFGASSCGTPATDNIPCTLPVFDTALFNASSYRNGRQYNFRIDQYFSKDRIYGSFYRTTLYTGSPTVRPQFATYLPYGQYALQLNESHTFSPSMINEAGFSVSLVHGRGATAAAPNMEVPVVNVTGLGVNIGQGGDLYFSQKSYHWRDVLTKVAGRHNLKLGYEGWTGDYLQDWSHTYNHPVFNYLSILDLVNDSPYTETGLSYDPVTGAKSNFFWDASQLTAGVFAEDNWRPTNKLTLNFGLRWDDFGNPYSSSSGTVLAPFFFGTGSDLNSQVATGKVMNTAHAMNQSITNIFSPRGGVAYDPTGSGKWIIKGGAGIYRTWPGEGALQGGYQGTPPGPVKPTFTRGSSPSPLLSFGTSNTSPYGFSFPTLPPLTIDSKGGIPGLNFGIGSVDPNLKSPISYLYTATLEREFFRNLVASVGYAGSRSSRILSGGGQQIAVQYGVDFNSYPGDLIQNNKPLPTRLNTSFGTISYAQNDRVGGYNAVMVSVRGRFANRGFFSGAYTHSSSMDDSQIYPTWQNPHQYYSPSVWDTPNRLALVWNYQLPDYHGSHSLMGSITSGWGLSGSTILQSGTPFTVNNTQPFKPTVDGSGKYNGILTTSGDYNADGDNNDYPNVISYKTSTSRQAYIHTGLFAKDTTGGQFAYGWANFPLPQFGQEGNEKYNGFRNPGFAQSNVAALKDTPIYHELNLELRFELYNMFNRPNLGAVIGDVSQPTFGESTTEILPRYIQFGATFKF
jgi:hypothetical protein